MLVADRVVNTAAELRRGERVRLRSLSEIEATLDPEGRTQLLPFMREMLPLVGRTLTVASRADKTCDTINMAGCSRKMTDTVHLEGIRCDGSAHGGCQAYCLLFFKEQWLERVPKDGSPGAALVPPNDTDHEALADRLDKFANVKPGYYRCQATQLLEATSQLKGNLHYATDFRTRNVPLRKLAKGLVWAAINRYQEFSYYHFPRRLLFRGGHRIPDMRGSVRDSQWPASSPAELQAGELVEVRSLQEIRSTLDDDQRNRGLWFDEEMADLCGKRGRILYRVERLIDEKTGRMLKIKKDLFVVAGMVSCQGIYHKLCTRNAIAMMRQAWLKRVE